jgi:hypothetical protein
VKLPRLLAVSFLVLGTSFLFTPLAQSDDVWQATNGNVSGNTVQFDFRGGSAIYTTSVPDSSTVTVAINNTIANCIGNCTPIADNWNVSINGQSFSGNTIEVTTVSAQVSGPVTITASGIDRGFWAGWYGPIISVSIFSPLPSPVPTPEPTPTPSPVPSVVDNSAAIAEQERLAREEAARQAQLEEERIAAEQERQRQAAIAAEQERQRLAAIEAARIAAEQEAARLAELERQRLAALEAERLRLEAEAKAKAEEEARLAAEAKAKAEEEARIAAELAAIEEARIAAEKAAEAARIEAERIAAELAAKQEAERLAALEAAAKAKAEEDARLKAEADAKAKAEAERLAAEAEANKPKPEVVPEVIRLTPETKLEELPPDFPILLENGVVLTAEVVIAIQLLENPAELVSTMFTNPAQALTALSNIGADMSPEVREESEKVVVSAIIASGIATQAAAGAAATAAYRRKP